MKTDDDCSLYRVIDEDDCDCSLKHTMCSWMIERYDDRARAEGNNRLPLQRPNYIITLEKVDIESRDGHGVLGDHCVFTEAVKCHFAHVQSSFHHAIGSILTKNILKLIIWII